MNNLAESPPTNGTGVSTRVVTPQRPVASPKPPGVTDLLRDLLDHTTTLVRKEIELAQVELTEKAEKAGRNAIKVAMGGFVAYAGAILLSVSLAFAAAWGLSEAGLNYAVSLFLGFLIMGAILGIGGYIMVRKASEVFTNGELAPKRTIRTVKEDVEWAKEKVS